MRILKCDTILKRQLKSFIDIVILLSACYIMILIIFLISAEFSGKKFNLFGWHNFAFQVFLLVQVFISGILIGAEEEENGTHSLILRLPISKFKWVYDRILAALFSVFLLYAILCIVFILSCVILKIPLTPKTLASACIISVMSFSTIPTVFTISLAVSSMIKKVLPSAVVSGCIIFAAIMMIWKSAASNPAKNEELPSYIILNILISLIFIGLFTPIIIKREGK